MSESSSQPIPLRVQGAVYASGYLATGMQNMAGLLIPLWLVLTFDPTPLMAGIILGARPLLPGLLSIHGGAMMDHLGAKRVMIFFALVGIAVHLLFPAAGWIWLVIVLQMISGLATTMSWMGAQTLIGQIMKGDATHAGRLGSASLLGNLTVPPIVGGAYDLFGSWGAFGVMSLWALLLLAAAMLLPAPSKNSEHAPDRMRARDFVPRLSSYIDSFALLAIPAIAIVVAVSVMRNTTYQIRGTFYVVYLESINLTGTEIGLLMSMAGLVGAVGALWIGRMTKFVKPIVLLFITVAGAVIFISIPPLTDVYWQLGVIAGCWGASVGMSMPLMFSIMSKAADARSQGKGVGIRITANRLSAAVLPVLMGAIAEVVGIENSFYVVGAAMLAALIAVIVVSRRVLGESK
ncbi:MAG: MFS transporter [Acetobacterales bacterium]